MFCPCSFLVLSSPFPITTCSAETHFQIVALRVTDGSNNLRHTLLCSKWQPYPPGAVWLEMKFLAHIFFFVDLLGDNPLFSDICAAMETPDASPVFPPFINDLTLGYSKGYSSSI